MGLVNGVPFGVVMGAMTGLRHRSWRDALIEAAIAATGYGSFMGFFMHRQVGQSRDAMGSVPRSEVQKAVRAARTGRVPEDPEVRRAAYRLVGVQLEQLRSQRRWAPPCFVLVAAWGGFLAVTQSPWWWLAVPFWVVMLTLHLALPRRLGRRLDLLRD